MQKFRRFFVIGVNYISTLYVSSLVSRPKETYQGLTISYDKRAIVAYLTPRYTYTVHFNIVPLHISITLLSA